MNQILGLLEGKKTHILVLLAVGLLLGGAADPDQIAAGGLDFTQIDFNRLLQAVLAGAVSTFKAGMDRKG